MPYTHTQTSLQVLVREGLGKTASIDIGTALRSVNQVVCETDLDARDESLRRECEADAVAIFDLLNDHLPERTLANLTRLYSNLSNT